MKTLVSDKAFAGAVVKFGNSQKAVDITVAQLTGSAILTFRRLSGNTSRLQAVYDGYGKRYQARNYWLERLLWVFPVVKFDNGKFVAIGWKVRLENIGGEATANAVGTLIRDDPDWMGSELLFGLDRTGDSTDSDSTDSDTDSDSPDSDSTDSDSDTDSDTDSDSDTDTDSSDTNTKPAPAGKVPGAKRVKTTAPYELAQLRQYVGMLESGTFHGRPVSSEVLAMAAKIKETIAKN